MSWLVRVGLWEGGFMRLAPLAAGFMRLAHSLAFWGGAGQRLPRRTLHNKSYRNKHVGLWGGL